MSKGNGLAWARLVAIRAALVGMQGNIDESRVRLREAENVARQAGQVWSSLSDEMVNGEKPRNGEEIEQRYGKMEKARRELKRREAEKNSVKAEVQYLERESGRLRTQFDTVFDEAAKGEGLFDRSTPGADQLRAIDLSDIVPSDAFESLAGGGVRTVGDFIDTVKRRGGVANLGIADATLKAACEAVAAAVRATGDGDLPPVLREYVPEIRREEAPVNDHGSADGANDAADQAAAGGAPAPDPAAAGAGESRVHTVRSKAASAARGKPKAGKASGKASKDKGGRKLAK